MPARLACCKWPNSNLPFLYHTASTLRISSRHSRRCYSNARSDAIPFEGANAGSLPSKRDARSSALSDSNPPSTQHDSDAPRRTQTMTDTERKAFERLFDSLARQEHPKRSSSSRNAHQHNLGAQESNTGSWLPHRQSADIDSSLEPESDVLMDLETDAAGASVHSNFPSGIRDLAARAQIEVARKRWMSRQKASQGHTSPPDKTRDAHLHQQQETLNSIQSSLMNAQTDKQLWHVLQTELIQRLDHLEKQRQKDKRSRHNRSIEDIAVLSSELSLTQPSKQDGQKPRRGLQRDVLQKMKVLKPLPPHSYAALCLLAMRLLCRRSPDTPLAAALIPFLRRHNLTTSVLTISVALYNEWLKYTWEVSNDLGKMLSILDEMDRLALPMDRATRKVLNEAIVWGRDAQQGSHGAGIAAIENMMGRSNEYVELEKWQDRLQRNLEAQALAESRRVEMYRKMRAEGVFVDDDEDEDGDQTLQQATAKQAMPS